MICLKVIRCCNASRTCSAVSNILTLNNEKVNITHIDLGLRVRQIFDVTLNKYITNVKVNSNKELNHMTTIMLKGKNRC